MGLFVCMYGGVQVREMRAAVLAETGFSCSAGIAHNKAREGASEGEREDQQSPLRKYK